MDYNTLATPEVVDATANALRAKNIETVVVKTKAEALAKIREWIPKGFPS